jgi:ATP/ADP translocase
MSYLQAILDWFDVRRGEFRAVALSFFGAFFIIAFMILAKSLREGLYLGNFAAKTLPYVIVTVALLGLPLVGYFAKILGKWPVQKVMRMIPVVEGLGLLMLWPWVDHSRVAVVAFYLWTALGTIILTSGFWIVVSEHFPLRGAKRLFGLISAGGTAGAMITGTSLGLLTRSLGTQALVLVLVGMLAIFLITLILFSAPSSDDGEKTALPKEDTSLFNGLGIVARNHHLRLIACIVATATVASVLLDFQFKDLVQTNIGSKAGLTGFFGAFYGWTGAASLIVQLALTSRLLSRGGIGWTLAVLPLGLFLGSMSLLIFPSLILVTAVRGFDNSLRKSLHRSALEVLYVPISDGLRRKTKTFIDSTMDSMAEGAGALVIFLWVTLAGFSSRWLSLGIMLASGTVLYFAYRMNKEYFITLVDRLKEGRVKSSARLATGEIELDLLSASFTRLDLQKSLEERGIVFEDTTEPLPPSKRDFKDPGELENLEMLNSRDAQEVCKALHQIGHWEDYHVSHLMRLLANRNFYETVEKILGEMGENSLFQIVQYLREESNDFVIRRRLPRILAGMNFPEADQALLDVLSTNRFEIRYRAGVALLKRRKSGLQVAGEDWPRQVWEAIRFEINRERPVWEIQKLLDDSENPQEDNFVHKHAGIRGEFSLEHTFRLLALVLDPVPVRTAFQGILHDDEKLKSISLEYLEQALPKDVRGKLWPFIGDVSEASRRKSERPLGEVVQDLLVTGRSLFGDPESRQKLQEVLKKINSG